MKRLFLGGAVLLLAGCSSQPLYTAHYYQTHKKALQKELHFCDHANTLSGVAKKNCETAEGVRTSEALLGGMNNNIMP